MSGRIKPLVLDSNVIINFINKKMKPLPNPAIPCLELRGRSFLTSML